MLDQKSLNFISKAEKVHGNYCDYSKTKYINAHTKVCIICPIHGEFYQIPRKHLRSKSGGCPQCSRINANNYRKLSIDEFMRRAKLIHGNRYTYHDVEYNKITDKIIIKCPVHGDFTQVAASHLQGHGCPKCARKSNKKIKNNKYTTEWFVDKAIAVHGSKYDYSLAQYEKSDKKIKIICPIHGEFEQISRDHLVGFGCPSCGISKLNELNKLNIDNFIERANALHLNKYTYNKAFIVNNNTKITIWCPIHGDFEQTPKHHLRGQGCPKCNLSSIQLKMLRIFDEAGVNITINDRDIIAPYEIDILDRINQIGVEAHGNYWHSFNRAESRDEIYTHQYKYRLANEANIFLFQFFEYEINEKFDIIRSMIRHKMGLSTKINARCTKFMAVDNNVASRFYDNNHIQGSRIGANYGLFYNDSLYMLASFAKYRDGYELLRMCSLKDNIVIGGLSKIIKNWAQIINPKFLMTYADCRYSNAIGYIKAGFVFDSITKPGYKWVYGSKIYSRQMFQKHKLNGKLDLYNKDLSESDNMFSNSYRRLWDAGHHKLFKYWKTYV